MRVTSKCCICKQNEATIHLTHPAGEKMHEFDLCEQCAEAKGANDPSGDSIADIVLRLTTAQQGIQPERN